MTLTGRHVWSDLQEGRSHRDEMIWGFQALDRFQAGKGCSGGNKMQRGGGGGGGHFAWAALVALAALATSLALAALALLAALAAQAASRAD